MLFWHSKPIIDGITAAKALKAHAVEGGKLQA